MGQDISYSGPQPRILLRIGEILVYAVIDTSCSINIMSTDLKNKLNLTANTDSDYIKRALQGNSPSIKGIIENVPITIAKVVKIKQHFFVRDNSNLILGIPFLRSVQAGMKFNLEGQCLMNMVYKGKVFTFPLNVRGKHIFDVQDPTSTRIRGTPARILPTPRILPYPQPYRPFHQKVALIVVRFRNGRIMKFTKFQYLKLSALYMNQKREKNFTVIRVE